jgi:hypothetical protein
MATIYKFILLTVCISQQEEDLCILKKIAVKNKIIPPTQYVILCLHSRKTKNSPSTI